MSNIFDTTITNKLLYRWVYKHIFVSDGNFKADHVRQKNEVDDVWLSEGSGMIPRRKEYFSFLATAIEKMTVSRACTLDARDARYYAGYCCQILCGIMSLDNVA